MGSIQDHNAEERTVDRAIRQEQSGATQHKPSKFDRQAEATKRADKRRMAERHQRVKRRT